MDLGGELASGGAHGEDNRGGVRRTFVDFMVTTRKSLFKVKNLASTPMPTLRHIVSIGHADTKCQNKDFCYLKVALTRSTLISIS